MGGVLDMGVRRTATQERIGTGLAPGDVDPAFHRAILKIALELKKPNAESYESVVEKTIRALRLDGEAFRRYLGANRAQRMGLLLATASTASKAGSGVGSKLGPGLGSR
jgi:hypothetical protein